jgi:hypothetical protein
MERQRFEDRIAVTVTDTRFDRQPRQGEPELAVERAAFSHAGQARQPFFDIACDAFVVESRRDRGSWRIPSRPTAPTAKLPDDVPNWITGPIGACR